MKTKTRSSSIDWVFGIDPGLKGALAGIDLRNEQVSIVPFSDFYDPKHEIPEFVGMVAYGAGVLNRHVLFAIEHSRRFPKLTENTGRILGALDTFEIPYRLVKPAEWKRHFGLLGQSKKASIDLAEKLFPDTSFSKHDEAEALLIAEYARRNLLDG